MQLRKIGIILPFICLSGCVSSKNIKPPEDLWDPFSKCNGYSKRPLNKSMWDWEQQSSSSDPKKHANAQLPIHNEKSDIRLAGNLTFKEIESYKNCG